MRLLLIMGIGSVAVASGGGTIRDDFEGETVGEVTTITTGSGWENDGEVIFIGGSFFAWDHVATPTTQSGVTGFGYGTGWSGASLIFVTNNPTLEAQETFASEATGTGISATSGGTGWSGASLIAAIP